MNCICRFTRWNKLTPEVRYRIPAGFRLNTVSATTGADVITDLLWSVTDQNAVIQLPPGTGDSFVLVFQLVRLTAGDVQKQPVPVSELQQFSDCVVAPDLLLAVRTNSVFSVLPPQNATGNWIKIVQRLPVRIQLPLEQIEQYPLRLGLSLEVTIDTHNRKGRELPFVAPIKKIYSSDVYGKQIEGVEEVIAQVIAENVDEDEL